MTRKNDKSPQKDVWEVLSDLQRDVQAKNDEIDELRSLFDKRFEKLEQSLLTRDNTILELTQKIDLLTLANNQNDLEQSQNEEHVKSERDLLVIGDSLIRHLDESALNPGGDTTINCIPGGRPNDVAEEFRKIAKTEKYKRIIVHIGSNMIPRYTPSFCANKIIECMDIVKKLAPDSQVAYSCVLPKIGNHLLPGINFVNEKVVGSSRFGPPRRKFGFIQHEPFFCDSTGHVDAGLFGRDGLHLSTRGISALQNSMKRLL